MKITKIQKALYKFHYNITYNWYEYCGRMMLDTVQNILIFYCLVNAPPALKHKGYKCVEKKKSKNTIKTFRCFGKCMPYGSILRFDSFNCNETRFKIMAFFHK